MNKSEQLKSKDDNPMYNSFNFPRMVNPNPQEEEKMAPFMTVFEKNIANLSHDIGSINRKIHERVRVNK